MSSLPLLITLLENHSRILVFTSGRFELIGQLEIRFPHKAIANFNAHEKFSFFLFMRMAVMYSLISIVPYLQFS